MSATPRLAACTVLATLAAASAARADATPQTLPFTQNWSDTTLISANDNWSGVPGIVGYRGDGLASAGADPQTVLGEGTPVVDVNANQTNPNTFTTGGVTEFQITDPVVALAGSDAAGAPNIVIHLNLTGQSNVTVSYNVRDVDGSADNATQQVALQYRVGSSGNFTNLPAGYIADATTGPSLATAVTAVNVTLPAAVDNQPLVQIRIMTTNAAGADEWVGIDDISITAGTAGPVCGNGTVEAGEACDGGACCTASCTFVAMGTSCRASAGACDVAEVCTGASATCPADGFAAVGTTCRASVGACDVAETCTGTAACPADAAQPAGTACGGAPSGLCDAQDVCSGTVGATAVCEARFAPSSTVCRMSAGVCDVVETCTGSSATCPADAFASSATVCRASGGACDVAETCTGTGAACPGDVLLGADVVCRPAAGTCDAEERCTGFVAGCPGDSVLPIGTTCRASRGVCDVAETCTGFPTCPSDGGQPDGTPCADGLVCNGTEVCRAGACASPGALSCDDGNACTADSCAEPSGCRASPIAGCCNLTADCADDGDVCTSERCTGPGGRCESLPIAGCCTADADCPAAGGSCVMARCDLATNRCESVPVPGCCTVDSDCDDGLACTVDNCNPTTGACTARATPGCCVSDGDCDDGDDCTADACMRAAGAPTGMCAGTPIAGCCVADADCGEVDGDLCTVPSCNVVAGRCVEGPVDCDDGDPCTADACAADGSCTHAPIAGCGMDDAGMMMGDDAGMMMGDDAGMMMGDDAGMMVGVDAGPMPDAAMPPGTDAAVTRDAGAGLDAGVVLPDAGEAPPGRADCGCSVPGPAGGDRAALALGLLGLLGLVARRQRRKSERA
jgi:hypothetical protein